MASLKNRQRAYLALASGRVFQGWIFGASPDDATGEPTSRFCGEVVFNTSLTGYQEILTDPSYQGQIVVMTPSHIGNTGINTSDTESRRLFLSGFVVQELSGLVSNWRSEDSLDNYLMKAGVPGISGIDTRALTRHLRSQGAVNGLISLNGQNLDHLVQLAQALPSMEGQDLVKKVTTDKPYQWNEDLGPWATFKVNKSTVIPECLPSNVSIEGLNRESRRSETWIPASAGMTTKEPDSRSSTFKKVVVVDYGVKQNILRSLVERQCEVTVVPASSTASEILAHQPDGVVLSNGPGDPAVVSYGIQTIRDLVNHNLSAKRDKKKLVPIMGICLGHQLLGLALGGQTYKLKFGHHGSNHPIKDLETGQVDITSQNHGFCVEGEKTNNGEWVVKGNNEALVTHINLNDNAIEGLRHRTLPMFSVQYHPEASGGPHDAKHLFDRFLKLMESNAQAN